MEEICCVLDIEGFSVKLVNKQTKRFANKFLIRELSFVKVCPSAMYESQTFYFDLGVFKKDSFEKKDWQTITYQQKKVHGLSFYPNEDDRQKFEFIPFSETNDVLRDTYNVCRTEELTVVAYKGGAFEKKYLEQLGIPCVNLENFGCPSFKELFSAKPAYAKYICGNHNMLCPEARVKPPVHCAQTEVIAYRDWVMAQNNWL